MGFEKEILVAYIDDHVSVRESISANLDQDSNIRVIYQGSSGKEFIDIIQSGDHVPDICLIDIEMPGMNGFELLKLIRKHLPKMKCIAFTAFNLDSYISEMYRNGVNGYILKTWAIKEVIYAINEVYKTGTYHSELTDRTKKNARSINFNEREIEFLKYVPSELSYADIAAKMGLTYKTIEGIRDRLCLKLNIKTRSGLIVASIQLGYFTIRIPNFQTQR